jgi:hypothetical protein
MSNKGQVGKLQNHHNNHNPHNNHNNQNLPAGRQAITTELSYHNLLYQPLPGVFIQFIHNFLPHHQQFGF